MFLIPSAPPMTSSIFWVISSSTISAEADLYSVCTWTTGGCIPSGNSLTGNSAKTKIPKIININDITQATTGLFMLTSVIYI